MTSQSRTRSLGQVVASHNTTAPADAEETICGLVMNKFEVFVLLSWFRLGCMTAVAKATQSNFVHPFNGRPEKSCLHDAPRHRICSGESETDQHPSAMKLIGCLETLCAPCLVSRTASKAIRPLVPSRLRRGGDFLRLGSHLAGLYLFLLNFGLHWRRKNPELDPYIARAT